MLLVGSDVTWECSAESRMIVVDHVRYALHFAPFAETEGDPLLGGSDFLSVVLPLFLHMTRLSY